MRAVRNGQNVKECLKVVDLPSAPGKMSRSKRSIDSI